MGQNGVHPGVAACRIGVWCCGGCVSPLLWGGLHGRRRSAYAPRLLQLFREGPEQGSPPSAYSPHTYGVIANVLVKLGKQDELVPRLLTRLRTGNAASKKWAATVLGEMEPSAGMLAPLLVELLKSPQADVRYGCQLFRTAPPRWRCAARKS